VIKQLNSSHARFLVFMGALFYEIEHFVAPPASVDKLWRFKFYDLLNNVFLAFWVALVIVFCVVRWETRN